MKYNVLYTERANNDLRDIFKYIAYNLMSPEIAKNQINRIINEIDSLCEMPNRNPLYEKEIWRKKGLRKLVIDNFIAFYFVNENKKEVIVISIMYAGRNIEELL